MDNRINPASGPLTGIKVIELAGKGPTPFSGMLLSDMGAEVIRIDRVDQVGQDDPADPPRTLYDRGRRSIAIDLKNPRGSEAALRLIERSDVFIEGLRPGVMERLGLGPDRCFKRNPRLVYGRMTGWGQDGPYASHAGHDINYIALAGALEHIGRVGEKPVPPLNLVGDFGGGALLLVIGVCGALLHARSSGEGQVVDAAMVDGAALLMTMFHAFTAMGIWRPERGTNLIDSGAHFYEVYETADHKYVAVGAIEPQFYRELLERIGLDGDATFADQMDRENWPTLKVRLDQLFRSRTRDQWCTILEYTDACFAPVLSLTEASTHPHNKVRNTFTEVSEVIQPSPAPRFSRTPSAIQRPPPRIGQHTAEILENSGFNESEIGGLYRSGAVVQCS